MNGSLDFIAKVQNINKCSEAATYSAYRWFSGIDIPHCVAYKLLLLACEMVNMFPTLAYSTLGRTVSTPSATLQECISRPHLAAKDQ